MGTIEIFARNRLYSFYRGTDGWRRVAVLTASAPFEIREDRLTIEGRPHEFKASEAWVAARSGMFGLSVVTQDKPERISS